MAEIKTSQLRQQIREATDDELRHELERARQSLFQFRYQAATHQLDNTMSIRDTRKKIARLLTTLRERGVR